MQGGAGLVDLTVLLYGMVVRALVLKCLPWGTAKADINARSVENPELLKVHPYPPPSPLTLEKVRL